MNSKDDRDRSIDKLLRQSFRAGGGAGAAGSSCLDAETLAAWADGSLGKGTLATVEAHLSDCSRCQRIVAVLAKLPTSGPASEPRWQWATALRWLVPLAAGAAAIALWVAVPSRESSQSAVDSPQSTVGSPQSTLDSPQSTVDSRQRAGGRQQAAVSSPPSEVKTLPTAPPNNPARAGADETTLQKEKAGAAPERLDALRGSDSARAPSGNLGRVQPNRAEPVAGAPAAAAPKAEARAQTFASREANVIAQEVVSTTPLIRWRVGPKGLLQYTANGGATWEEVSSGVTTDLIAGASPSASVCWIVGSEGTVLLTVDGRRFERIPFAANVDLVGVAATDGRSATVTASDGRTFRTTDRGATWTP